MRETRTRYGKTQIGYLWGLIEPIVMIITFVLVFEALGRPAVYGDSLFMFFATGILPYLMFRRVNSFVTNAFDANRALLTYPIVQPIDTLLARACLEIATTLFVMLILIGIPIYFFDHEPPARIHVMAGSVALLALLGFGMGVINAVVIQFFESWKNIEAMLTRPLFFISGIFFVPEALPEKVRDYLSWNPILHGVELARYGYYFNYRYAGIDVPYLAGWALVLTLIGLTAERVSRQVQDQS